MKDSEHPCNIPPRDAFGETFLSRLLAELHHSRAARIRVAGGGAGGDAPDAQPSALGLPYGQPQPPKRLFPSWDTTNHGGVQREVSFFLQRKGFLSRDYSSGDAIPNFSYSTESESWRDGYSAAIERINALSSEMVTIGALCASMRELATAAKKNDRPTDLFDYLSEKDPSGFKYPVTFNQQVEIYRFVLDRLDRGKITPCSARRMSPCGKLLVWTSAAVTAF